MSKKYFTLIELITIIVILSILLSIVLMKTSDFKKKAVASSISSNISILQTAIDAYYLKEEKYPIFNSSKLNLSNPQEINIDLLVEEGYLKKEIDMSKVKNQYYWVDVFGKVWGATTNETSSINLLKTEDGSNHIEFKINSKFSGFNVYEVEGYSSLASQSNLLQLTADLNPSKKSYKVIDTVSFNGGSEQTINFKTPKNNASYLISMTDDYGLDLPPMGKFSGSKSPVFRGDGVYEFEIEGSEDMFWVDFLTLEDKKGESTINYRFKVKDRNGDFLPWTEDFLSLPESKHIVVELELKSDKAGNKPTLYDIQIIFKYKDEIEPLEEISPICDLDCYGENIICPPHGFDDDYSLTDGGGTKVIPFYINGNSTIDNTYISNPFTSKVKFKVNSVKHYIDSNGFYSLATDLEQVYKNKCGVVIYDVEVIELEEFDRGTPQPPNGFCGTGGSTSKFYGGTQQVVYNYYISEDTNVNSIDINISAENLRNIYYEQSVNTQPYKIINSLTEIHSPSCLNIVYQFEGNFNNPIPPVIKGCEGDCPKIELCEKDCVSKGTSCLYDCIPNDIKDGSGGNNSCTTEDCDNTKNSCEVRDCNYPPCTEDCKPLKEDSEWETLGSLRFFGYGPSNRKINWYEAVIKDEVYDKENTRIVYNYAKRDGSGGWSGLYEDFETTGTASSVMAVAFIQVRRAEKNNVLDSEYPIVKSISFKTEAGDLPASMTNPSLVIIPIKDNNKGNDIYTNTSNITWDVIAADPRGLAITNIEWSGDIRENYPVGTYNVSAKATNERGYTSDWVSYRLEVIEDKPTADFSLSDNVLFIYYNETVKFNTSMSKDLDGDGIVNYEWKNRKDMYTVSDGVKTNISLRVQDEEGNWSDWLSKEFHLIDKNNQFWFVNGLPPVMSGHLDWFDRDQSTYSFSNNINRVSWIEDISGETLYLDMHSNTSSNTVSVKFLDKNDKPLYSLSNKFGYTNEIIFSGRHQYKVIVPEGAKSMTIQSAYEPDFHFIVYSIDLINSEKRTEQITNITDTSSEFILSATFNKPSEVTTTYFINEVTGEAISTTNGLFSSNPIEPNSSINYKIVSVNSDFIASNTLYHKLNAKPSTNIFSGLPIEVFDKDQSTYIYSNNVGRVSWMGDISGETLYLDVHSNTSSNTVSVRFLDENNNPLNSLSKFGSLNEMLFSGRHQYEVIVPEGAKSLVIQSAYGTNNYYIIYSIHLVK